MADPSERRSLAPIALLAAAFFALGVAVSGDIGVTADERETVRAGERNLEIIAAHLAGKPAPDWSFHELTGYYFVVDTGRALWARALAPLGVEDPYRAQHWAHLLLSSATLGLVFALARSTGASPRAALLAALALATLPKFVAHSQNNPKDLPAAFTFALALYGVISTGLRGGFARSLLGGAALGLALTTRVHAVFAPLVGWTWLVLSRPTLARRDVTNQLVLLGSGALFAVAFWPWLWPAPLDNAIAAFQGLTGKVFTVPVLYLGQVYPANEVPWHYRAVLLLATTPVSWLALAGLGAAALGGRDASAARGTVRLAALWLAILALADGLVWSRYDGVRHFLMALPALALLAGAGAERALQWLEARRLPAALRALPLLPFAIGALAVASLHPYPNAILGAPARWLAADESDRTFELDYWGQSYLEAGRWLDQHSEPNAEMIVPLFPHLVRHSLGREVREGRVADWMPADRPRYLLVLARRAYWDAPLRALEREREPVFEIRRSGGRLLAIYRNQAPR
jgi:hypothetical protein